MSTLKSTIEELAADFATNIIAALRSASIEELTGVSTIGGGGRASSGGSARVGRPASTASESAAPARKAAVAPAPRGRGGRLGRRSTADIEGMVDNIVSLLQRAPDGMRAEQIRESLGVQAKELPRPLSDGLAAGKLRKSGQKRATTYYATGGKGGAGAAKKKSASKKA